MGTKVWYFNVKEILSVCGTIALGAYYLHWLKENELVDEEERERREAAKEQSFLHKAKQKVNRSLIEKFNLD